MGFIGGGGEILDGSITTAKLNQAVKDSIGKIFKNQSQLMFNNIYSGFDSRLNLSGSPDFLNLQKDLFITDSMTATKMSYDATNDLYFGPTGIVDGDLTAIDEFNDSSVDTTLWTLTTELQGTGAAASTTEDTADIILFGKSGNTSGSDFGRAICELKGSLSKKLSDYNYWVRFQTTSVSSVSGPSAGIIRVTDGTNQVDVYSANGDTAHTVDIIRIGNALYYRIDSAAFTFLNISSWTIANITIQLRAEGIFFNSSAREITFKVNWFRHEDFLTVPTCSIESAAATSSSTIISAFSTVNNQETDSPIIKLTADNGANYETSTANQYHEFTNTGTQLKTKIEYSGYSASFTVSEYSTIYNFL